MAIAESKAIEALGKLSGTGINLRAREFGTSNNGTIVRDEQEPLQDVVIWQGLNSVYRWGKIRVYGNKRTSVVCETKDGRLLWFQEKDQDSANRKPFAAFAKELGRLTHMPTDRNYEIRWQI